MSSRVAVVLPLMVASLLIAFIVTLFSLYQTPKYEASIMVLVGQRGRSISDFRTVTPLVAGVVDTMPVAKAVAQRLNLPNTSAEKVLGSMSVRENDPGEATPSITISYEDSDPNRAQQVVGTIAQVIAQKSSEVRIGNNPRIPATVWSPATLPKNPVSPKPWRNGFIALAAALLLSGVFVAGCEVSRIIATMHESLRR